MKHCPVPVFPGTVLDTAPSYPTINVVDTAVLFEVLAPCITHLNTPFSLLIANVFLFLDNNELILVQSIHSWDVGGASALEGDMHAGVGLVVAILRKKTSRQ